MQCKNGGTTLERRHSIPVLYVRGTHYEIGFDVGRTFASLIKNVLDTYSPLNNDFLPHYNTVKGKKVYDETLAAVKEIYPQYLEEIQGTADGAGVPFHKLFLLQMDDITPNVAGNVTVNDKPTGCTSVCVNEPNNEILGHTEDTLAEILNHFYILSAHIISDKPQGKWKVTEERFTSLCYAGHLPGYTMGFNHHGLVYSINTLSALHLHSGKIPRTFLTRALLTAENFEKAEKILAADGIGAADGCSVNLTFLKQEGDRMFHNIEFAPPVNDKETRSQMQVFTASPGEHIIHCNKYLRLQVPEVTGLIIESSLGRMECLTKHKKPRSKRDVIEMLSDQTGENFRVFESGKNHIVRTIAAGIFDCCEKTWSLYSDKPNCNEPLVVLPLVFK